MNTTATTTASTTATTASATGTRAQAGGHTPLVKLEDVGKRYGNIIALQGIDLEVGAGEVTCVLGDNGAGKSTLIKIIAGLHKHDDGVFSVEGDPVHLASPRQALDLGIATVYQDLAVAPLMPVWRNFFLGSEVTKGWGPFRRLDVEHMKRTTKQELLDMGIDLRDVDQPIGTLSGGERQCVAIARAVHFGAKVLILDEPTAALGVKQSGVVLRYIIQARERGLGVVFITHNPHHAYPVGDRFLLLKRGRSIGYYRKNEVTLDELTSMMAGGAELEELVHELAQTDTDTGVLRTIRDDIEEDSTVDVPHLTVTRPTTIIDESQTAAADHGHGAEGGRHG
ncbi:ATP-binding cassette domain-containing protein [Pseudoclavibacter sp. CFCC 13611]|uniref:ATP-binding cassette domain-containing protein n=1 Tax=Pseudoclavibacter sp. CFCC 13611 TaxID=2615178 RepID=UPI00130111AC|nr:ATP-binding cassette domain-containing protein [Pseudoclavibacter sp. CFCC 13611]KAB1664167.1 sugar ABC transporter ATP-binding protein [Pseudoclavibacter sp. CFCC 13611]